MQELIARAKELLADGTVARVLGWKAGDRLTIQKQHTLKLQKAWICLYTMASAVPI